MRVFETSTHKMNLNSFFIIDILFSRWKAAAHRLKTALFYSCPDLLFQSPSLAGAVAQSGKAAKNRGKQSPERQ
jgi:hypothetical protein